MRPRQEPRAGAEASGASQDYPAALAKETPRAGSGHHAGLAERLDLLPGVAGLRQYLVAVLAERGREWPDFGRRRREPERRVQRLEHARRVLYLGEGLTVGELGIGHGLLHRPVARAR